MSKVLFSKDNPKIKYACSLKEKKYRDAHNEFLGESEKSLKMAAKMGLVKEVFSYKYLKIDPQIPQYLVGQEVMKKLAYTANPEGVMFIAKIPSYNTTTKYNKILYLDTIQDPGNLGTLIRTALAFNYDAVVLSKNTVDLYNPKCLAACKGANFVIPVISNIDLKTFKDDYQIIVSSLGNNTQNVDNFKHKKKFVLVIGNEAHGVSPSSKKLATDLVKIEISNIDSLNAAIAGGILLYKIH